MNIDEIKGGLLAFAGLLAFFWLKKLINRKKRRLWMFGLPVTGEVVRVGRTGFNEGDDAFSKPILEVLVLVKDDQFKDVKVWIKHAFDENDFPEPGDYAKILIDPKDTTSATILNVFRS